MKKDSTAYKVVLLSVICAVCGLLLAGVNAFTAPIIEQNSMAGELSSLEQIYPNAEFTSLDFTDDTGYIEGVYSAEGEGIVYKLKGVGYNSDGFEYLLAFNTDGSVGGFVVLSENETSGFGKRCFEDEYVSTIEGLSASDEAPLLSGATLTSTAIQNSYAAAAADFATR